MILWCMLVSAIQYYWPVETIHRLKTFYWVTTNPSSPCTCIILTLGFAVLILWKLLFELQPNILNASSATVYKFGPYIFWSMLISNLLVVLLKYIILILLNKYDILILMINFGDSLSGVEELAIFMILLWLLRLAYPS